MLIISLSRSSETVNKQQSKQKTQRKRDYSHKKKNDRICFSVPFSKSSILLCSDATLMLSRIFFFIRWIDTRKSCGKVILLCQAGCQGAHCAQNKRMCGDCSLNRSKFSFPGFITFRSVINYDRKLSSDRKKIASINERGNAKTYQSLVFCFLKNNSFFGPSHVQ